MNCLKKTGRLLIAVCLLVGMPLTAKTVSASELQTHFMTVQKVSTTLKELFDLIEEKFDYSFLIRNNDIDLNERIDIDMTDRSVEDILTYALKKQKAEFTVNEDRIVVYKTEEAEEQTLPAIPVAQQNQRISGVVVDQVTGEPIIGANVIVRGTMIGTSTDIDGNFSLEAPANSVLSVSYIGYLPQDIAATSSPMTIRLREDTHALDEVVVVGYGVQKKESLTGAMQVVTAEELLDVTTSDVATMLQAKAPGVWVGSGGGEPGAEGQVLIRGKATINGSTAPLWVVDGVIMGGSAGMLNPNDIESISVLKDASSTAIYGSKGANGVIMVTTRKAKAGEARISVNAKWAASTLSTGNMKMMNGSELYDFFQGFTNQEAITFTGYDESLRNRNYDWWDKGSQTGFTQEYNLSVSGGSEKMKTYTSLGLWDETGAVKGRDFDRYTALFRTEYAANNWLTIRTKFQGGRRSMINRQHSIGAMYTNLPWDSPYDESGNLIQEQIPTHWIAQDKYNYQYDLQWNYTKSVRYDAMANFDFDIKITDWLTFASVNNYRYISNVTKTYTDPRSSGGRSVDGIIRDQNNNTQQIYANQLLRFNKTFDKHSVNGVFAYEWNTNRYEWFDQSTQGFAPGFTVAEVGATPRAATGGIREWAVQSLLFNANYAYDNRYLAQFAFRRDGASNFGTSARYGNFFSISAGWNIHQEDFFDYDWVQQLKVRASYGSVGNRPTSEYPQYALYSVSRKYNAKPGAMLSQLENKDLTWEKTYTTGFGIDAILFDRLTFNFDMYYKKTTDLLYNVPIPGVVGLDKFYQNVGQLDNKGIEVTLAYDIIKRKDMLWNVAGNLALNRNKVASLYGDGDPIINENSSAGVLGVLDKIIQVGSDMDTWYGAEWAGVDPQTGNPQWYYTTDSGARELTSNYSLAQKHQVDLGKMSPDFYGGFSTNFNWKDLSVSANFGYSVGGKVFSYNRTVYDSDGAYPTYNQQKMLKDWSRWEKPGDIATHPKLVYGNTSNSNKPSSRQLESASFLRLRNLTIGYTLPWKLPQVKSIRVNLSGENLFLWTNFSGPDPEPINTDNGRVGAFVNAYPQTRKYLLSLSINL